MGKNTKKQIQEKKRIAARARYQRIKNDEKKYAEIRQKDALKYMKRKERGKVKTVKEMTPLENSLARQRWREAYRKRTAALKGNTTEANKSDIASFDNSICGAEATFGTFVPMMESFQPNNIPSDYDFDNAAQVKSEELEFGPHELNQSTFLSSIINIDDYQNIATYWAQRLSRLQPLQRQHTVQLINDIFDEAERSSLQMTSLEMPQLPISGEGDCENNDVVDYKPDISQLVPLPVSTVDQNSDIGEENNLATTSSHYQQNRGKTKKYKCDLVTAAASTSVKPDPDISPTDCTLQTTNTEMINENTDNNLNFNAPVPLETFTKLKTTSPSEDLTPTPDMEMYRIEIIDDNPSLGVNAISETIIVTSTGQNPNSIDISGTLAPDKLYKETS